MKKCIYCNQPIILVPTAAARARKYGGKPSDYTNMFKAHGACQTKAWAEEARELLRATAAKRAAERVTFRPSAV